MASKLSKINLLEHTVGIENANVQHLGAIQGSLIKRMAHYVQQRTAKNLLKGWIE